MIGKLQDLFINLLNPWIPIVGKLKDKTKYAVITGCFFAMLVLFCIVRYVLYKESYFYNTTCGIVLMIIIAIMSLDRSLVRVHWRRSVWIAWFGMCIAFTISDILVPKKVCGLGLVLALVFTGVFFVWQNHTRKDLLWKCFKDAVKLGFWMMVIISFLFRPLYEGGRYAGIFTNPNTFALYLLAIFSVYMSDLDWIVETGKDWKRCISTYVSLAIIFFYLNISQARTSMLAIVCVCLLWLSFRIYISKKNRAWKMFLKNIILVMVFSVTLYPLLKAGVTHVPNWVGKPIVFEGESLYMGDGNKVENLGETVVAESGKFESSEVKEEAPQGVLDRIWYIVDKHDGLNALTSGRIDIYKGYTKKLNLKGHKNVSLVINGKRKNHAHNNWLQFGYTYGVISMIFYGIITILALGMSMKFYLQHRRKNATYAFLVPAICFGFVVATLAECLFLPFEVFPAFAFWFVFGDLFVKKVPKNKLLLELEERDT